MTLAHGTPARRAGARPAWLAYGATLGAVALAAGAALLVDRALGAPNASLVFVLPVVAAAASFGWTPALTAALAGVAAYNFLLIEPRHSFRVADPANLWALALLLATAAVVSAVAAQSRRRAVLARSAAEQAGAILSLARSLVGAASAKAVAEGCAEAVSRLFHAPAVVMLEDRRGLGLRAAAGGAALSDADVEAARWTLAGGRPARAGDYPAGDAAYDFWPVTTRARKKAVIGVRLADLEDGRPEAADRLVGIVEGYLAVALDREAYAERAMARRVRSARERLKADLLAAVSHDLKTPLSTILVSLQSLRRFGAAHDAEARAELLAAAEAETARLARMVDNLLDMGRIEAGAVRVRPAPADPGGLVAGALERAGPALAGRKVVTEQGRARGPLLADAGLFETALANLLENAAKYSPEGSTVRVRTGVADGMGFVEVLDEGPGFDGPPEALFERFARGREDDGRPPGVGLGLSIAKSFMEAQGGRIEAANRADGRGARVRLCAPLAGTVPA